MNTRLITLLLLTLFSALFFSACTSVESKEPEEVVFDDRTKTASDEVIITDADLQEKGKSISITQERSELGKRILSDNSEVETLIDAFGNKTERRNFANHYKLRMVVLRTTPDGKQEVTVYGYGRDTKVVYDLGDKALTASADEIATAANLTTTRGTNTIPPNFMKKANPDPALQPLPSSQFPKPVAPVVQPVAPVEQQSENKSENAETPQAKTEKDMEN